MKLRALFQIGAFLFLGALLEFLAASSHPLVAFLATPVVGLLFLAADSALEWSSGRLWIIAVCPGMACLLGVLLHWMAHGAQDWVYLLVPVLASGLAAGVSVLRNWNARRCGSCNRHLSGRLSFQCPRCPLVVCEESCWVFDRCCCVVCDQNQVPVFPAEDRWWEREFGPLVQFGRCHLCKARAADSDLRACGRCRRTHCRLCWDHANGKCTNCGWIVVGLPPKLRPFVIDAAAEVDPQSREIPRKEHA